MTAAFPVLSSPDGPLARYVQVFAGTTASVAAARRFTSAVLAACPAREALVACVSELAANAVVHTASGDGGVFTVEVIRPRDGIARVAVTDAGSSSAPAVTAVAVPEATPADAARTDAARADAAWARTDGDWADHEWPADGADGVGRGLAMVADLADMDAEGGRGLALVAALAHSWGYRDVPPPRCAVPSDAIPSGAVPRDAVPSGAGPGVPVSSALSGRLIASPASGRTVWAEACWPVGVPDSTPR